MDVQFLYPNIDQKEGIDACKSLLDKRNNRAFPTNQLTKLIQLILESNTVMFNGRYFHQIKGTAMGTPMALSYANIFMSVFDSNMLLKYQNKYNCKPTSWLRFIDIFFNWPGDEKSLKHFLNFCNNYSKNKGMQSTIKFTYSYSTLTVNFLDVTVKVEKNGTLSTNLFAKPTASYQHLHAKSSHPFHTMKALQSHNLLEFAGVVHSHKTIGNTQIY